MVAQSSDSIIASNKKCTSKKEPTSVSEIAIQNLLKTIKIPLLCKCELFINAEVSKNSIGLKIWFSTSVDIRDMLKEPFIFSLSFYSFLVKLSDWHRRSGTVKLWQRWMRWDIPLCKWHTFLNDPIFNLLVSCHIIERKWLLMRNLAIILSSKSKLSRKFQRFNTTDESIEILKNSWISRNLN